MNRAKVLSSEIPLPGYPQNLAIMLNENASRFGQHPLYQEVRNQNYVPLSWRQFQQDVTAIQSNLLERGLKPGNRVAILSANRQEMLELELAVMALGARAVPIFAGYTANWADTLVRFCNPRFVAVADQVQYDKLSAPESFPGIIHFESVTPAGNNRLIQFSDLLMPPEPAARIIGEDVAADCVCLMMYTSGTMGKPKCVQLTHSNILSQQSAMRTLWKLSHHDRFLSYLPWHHSFGGIFEKYAAITNGAVFSLEHSFGKDINLLLSNWKQVRPTVFFSVPRIYQELITLVLQDSAVEKLIFHDELRFIFTAAAPLPNNISDVFYDHNIPVIEGWGLTETSPCCTVTDPNLPRVPGIVGKPIPGVTLKIADDGEIIVHGPNVMKGYYKNPETTKKVLSKDGWFATGDVGEFDETRLRLISRKDRIFKLSNAKKVIPTKIENLITEECTYLAQAYVSGKGRDYPVAILFPNKTMLFGEPDELRLKEGCECPKTLDELSSCLKKCLALTNDTLDVKYYRLKSAMIVDYELSIENKELTPSMKLAPGVIGKVFEANIEYLYGNDRSLSEQVFVINLE